MPKIISNKSNVDLDYPVVRPSLDLDFTQEELDPRITFSRGTSGTRVNRNRLIETVAANQPRFDYDLVTGECKGLLIEESRTNLITNSNTDVEFSNGARPNTWTSGQLAPDGSSTAKLCVTNNRSFKEYISASVNNVVSTFSIYLKTNGSIVTRTFDLRDIASDTVRTTKTITITPNWQRFDITGTVQSNGIRIEITGGIFNIFAWGAQLEVGAFPTSYIPTDSTPGGIVRSSDLVDMTGTNFSSWYNQNEGTIYTNNRIPYTPNPNVSLYFIIFGINAGNRISIEQTTTNQLNCFVSSSNTTQGFFLSSTILPENINRKTSLSYSSSNNQTLISKTSNQLYTFSQKFRVDIYKSMTTLYIGRFNNSLYFLNGTISRFTYYPRKLKDNQLLYLTQ